MSTLIVSSVGFAYGWFNSNNGIGVSAMSSAQFGVSVTAQLVGLGSNTSEPIIADESSNFLATVSLEANRIYIITINRTDEASSINGYCLVQLGESRYYAPIADSALAFSVGTGLTETPENLTAAQFDELIAAAPETELIIEAHWGSYGSDEVQGVRAALEPVLLSAADYLGVAPLERPEESVEEIIPSLNMKGIHLPAELDARMILGEDFVLPLILSYGYMLPETVAVIIDSTMYEIYTDGATPTRVSPEGESLSSMPMFNTDTNELTIPAGRFEQGSQVTIIAHALLITTTTTETTVESAATSAGTTTTTIITTSTALPVERLTTAPDTTTTSISTEPTVEPTTATTTAATTITTSSATTTAAATTTTTTTTTITTTTAANTVELS